MRKHCDRAPLIKGRKKRSGQTRQVFEIAWNIWRNFAHLGARRAPIVQTAQAQSALLFTVQYASASRHNR